MSLIDRLVKSRYDLKHRDNNDAAGDRNRLTQLNLKRDLDTLLNTRQLDENRRDLVPLTLSDVRKSSFFYGLPDFGEVKRAEEIENLIAHAIRTFEPRLLVSVQHQPRPEAVGGFSMSFRIVAKVMADPYPIPFAHEPVIDVEYGRVRLRKAKGQG